jgi:hypothetical protein
VSGRPGRGSDAINDPDVLWAVIEGLLARIAELPDSEAVPADPIVHVVAGDRTHHHHPNCPLLVETRRQLTAAGRSAEIRRTVRSGAVRAGLRPCPACRTHRPGPEEA